PSLPPEEDVAPDAEVRHERSLLRDEAHARVPRCPGRLETCWGAVDRDLAVRGQLEAGEQTHERRLPGAVLAHDRVDLPLAEVEVDAVDRANPGVRLADAREADERPPGDGATSTSGHQSSRSARRNGETTPSRVESGTA